VFTSIDPYIVKTALKENMEKKSLQKSTKKKTGKEILCFLLA